MTIHSREFTGRWVAGMMGLGTLLALMAAVNGRPIIRLLEQFQVIAVSRGPRADLSQKFSWHAGAMLPRFCAVDTATALVIRRSDGQPASAEQQQLFDRLLAADADNAAVPCMLAAIELMKDAPAPQRLRAAKPLLDKIKDYDTTTWYASEIRDIWTRVWKEEGLGDVEALLRSDLTVGFDHAHALRATGQAFLRAAAELATAGDTNAAMECYARLIDLARGGVHRRTVPTVALVAAELLEEAYRQRALLTTHSDRGAGQADLAASARAHAFLDAYRRAAEKGPPNVLDLTAKRTTRPIPYQQMMTTLLATAAMAAAAMTAAVLMCLAAAILTLHRLFLQDAGASSLPVRSRFWFLVGSAGVVLCPALTTAAMLQSVPMREEYWGSVTWVGKTVTGVAALTAWAVVAAAVWWTGRSHDCPGRTRRIWHASALLMAALAILAIFPQWRWYGWHETWFDRSWQLPWAVARYDTLALLPLLSGLWGAVIWTAAALVQRRRASPEDQNNRLRFRIGMIRAIFFLSCVGFVPGTGGLLLAERAFHHYDRKYRTLFVADMADELRARLGPSWRTNYFFPPEPSL